MLEKEEYDSWIANIFKGVKVVELFRILRVYPIVGTPILYLLQNLPMVTKARRKHQQYSMDKVAKRLDSVTDRRDFLRWDKIDHSLSQPAVFFFSLHLIFFFFGS